MADDGHDGGGGSGIAKTTQKNIKKRVGKGKGSRLGITTSAAKRRKVQQDKTYVSRKINLGAACTEWQSLRSQCGFSNDNIKFARHLMENHVCHCNSSTTTRSSVQYAGMMTSTPVHPITRPRKLFESPSFSPICLSEQQPAASMASDKVRPIPATETHEEQPCDRQSQDVTVEEEVFDFILDGDDDEEDSSENVQSAGAEESDFSFEEVNRLTDDDKFITYKVQLMAILHDLHGQVCQRKGCSLPLSYSSKTIGTAMLFSWVCTGGHKGGSWCSQPRYTGILAGNLQVASSVLLSGNSFLKVALFFKFARIAFISKTTFYRVQRLYAAPAIEDYWKEMQHEYFLKNSATTGIHLVGDGRNDSPGFSSQYCTYTMVDGETKEVIHMEIVDSREVDGKSPNMEVLGFERAMQRITKEVNVSELTTDAHSSISGKMTHCQKYQGITHNWDTWHGGKNIYKKALEIAGQKGNGAIIPWADALRSHFWYASKKCNGDPAILKAIWISYLHHCVDEHTWIVTDGLTSGHCEHGELDDGERKRPWLKKDSPEHKALRELVFQPRLLKTIHHYTNFRHTGFLECYHNHILMYAPKRHSYSFTGYKSRNQLAAIDWTKHRNRPQQVGPDGKPIFGKKYSKRSKNWTAHPKAVPKSYAYIAELMERIFLKRLWTGGHLSQHVSFSSDDPKRISASIARVPAPSLEKLINDRAERMQIN